MIKQKKPREEMVLTQALIRENFGYDPDLGEFRHLKQKPGRGKKGELAGRYNKPM